MKATELMIGDWVELYGTPTRWEIEDYAKWHKEMERTDVHTFEPIPLTADILEKNGFAVHRQFETFTEYWLDIPQKWVRVAPNSYIEIYNGENRNVHIDGKVYVHELQHALRLCGIDKKIVL